VKDPSRQGESTFIFVAFFLIISFWLMIGAVMIAVVKGVGHDIQHCPSETEQVPATASPSTGEP
jgi:hypothetical protein